MFHDDYNDISDISKISLQGIWIPPVKTRVITSPSSLSLRLWKPFLQPHCFLFCLFSRPQLVHGACQIPLKHCAFGCSRLIKAQGSSRPPGNNFGPVKCKQPLEYVELLDCATALKSQYGTGRMQVSCNAAQSFCVLLVTPQVNELGNTVRMASRPSKCK